MKICRLMLFFLPLMLALTSASAQSPALTGYNSENKSYQYAVFGRYPYTQEGETAPVLWRVLGPGVADQTDIINERNSRDFREEKYANADTLEGENSDLVCMITEYIIDVAMYHPIKDELYGTALDYANTQIRETLNREILPVLFTAQEQAVLADMPDRGLLSAPSRKGELFNNAYGFISEDFGVHPARAATGTPYAFAQGLRRINGYSWYWTTDWRRYGYRWIVGDNGHISVSGCDRVGGVRPLCYVHADQLEIAGGTGTLEDPFVLQVK
ncbi:MAG: hypothetical protein IKK34_11980 [Clostridia bacterium]|nr:hypothetical protein [Clostridia bacterium]